MSLVFGFPEFMLILIVLFTTLLETRSKIQIIIKMFTIEFSSRSTEYNPFLLKLEYRKLTARCFVM